MNYIQISINSPISDTGAWLMDVDVIQHLRLHQRIKFVNYTQGHRSVAAKTGACVRTKGQHFQQTA